VVHTHGKGAGFYGRLAAKLAGVPAVHTFHGIHYESYSRSGRGLYLALERALARITHTVINVSQTQDEEARRLGVARRSVVVVNGIDVDELQRRKVTNKEDLGLSPDSQVVGCVARFDPVKNHELLLRALAIVRERHPKVVLLLAGEGPEKARITRLAAELNVRILPSDAATAWSTNLYRSCDVYVSASSKEGLPLAPLEAMASERAVVATDVPGHHDVIEHGETGLLVPPNDAQTMAVAIASLLDEPERRRQMGKRGAERVRRSFTLHSMVARTANVYRAAAASRRG
jgi:glycosyltransferase involved in cell wall biosynthesis